MKERMAPVQNEPQSSRRKNGPGFVVNSLSFMVSFHDSAREKVVCGPSALQRAVQASAARPRGRRRNRLRQARRQTIQKASRAIALLSFE